MAEYFFSSQFAGLLEVRTCYLSLFIHSKIRIYNSFTGLKRKNARCDTPRKKRETTTPTVGSRMFAQQAMEACRRNMTRAKMVLAFASLVMASDSYDVEAETKDLVSVLLLCGVFTFNAAIKMFNLMHN